MKGTSVNRKKIKVFGKAETQVCDRLNWELRQERNVFIYKTMVSMFYPLAISVL